LRYELALANRMLAHEGVLDAFGHVSARHPNDPGRYLLARSRSPELIEPADVLEYTLDSQPVVPPSAQLYAERVIHGEIYRARPDVMAVCHHHAAAIMPFCIAGEPLVPVFHLGAACGATVPFWDQRDDFGDTNLLVGKAAEGASLARALGRHAMVLMRNHGATVVGEHLRQLVFRAIYACRNAEYQSEAKRLGTERPLTPGEVDQASALNAMPNVTSRTWEYWTARLAKAGELPPPGGPAMKAAPAGRKAPARANKPGRASPARRSRRKR
jgi:HCOMODA/2-hydroxy-3-carboxy-muconic semialdehyde decarboxylase